jgi:hypothetical protein
LSLAYYRSGPFFASPAAAALARKAIFSLLFLTSLIGSTVAQSTFLNTGQGNALTSRSVILNLGTSTQPVVTFDFGFGTDELTVPGTLLDSFSVSIAAAVGSPVGQLITADAFGFVWGPANAGGFEVDGATITRRVVALPAGGGTFRSAEAFSVSWAIPQQFRGGGSVEVTFDLFDNLDQTASVGFFTSPVIVPEPSAVALLSLSSFVILWRLRRRS